MFPVLKPLLLPAGFMRAELSGIQNECILWGFNASCMCGSDPWKSDAATTTSQLCIAVSMEALTADQERLVGRCEAIIARSTRFHHHYYREEREDVSYKRVHTLPRSTLSEHKNVIARQVGALTSKQQGGTVRLHDRTFDSLRLFI